MRFYFPSIAFALLFNIPYCYSHDNFIESLDSTNYEGFRCGKTFFARDSLLSAANNAATKLQGSSTSSTRGGWDQHPKAYRGIYDFGPETRNAKLWPIQRLPSKRLTSNEDQASYFLVLGGRLQPIGVVYTPSGYVDVLSRCEIEREISNRPSIEHYNIVGFRCPSRILSFQQIEQEMADDQKFKAASDKMQALFNHPQPLYMRRIRDNLPSDIGPTFLVLDQYNSEVGVVQRNKLLKDSSFVKCKLTADLTPYPEFINLNLQKTSKEIKLRQNVNVFQCGTKYFTLDVVMQFAAKAAIGFQQKAKNPGNIFPLLLKQSYNDGFESLFVWPATLSVEENNYYPYHKIFDSGEIFLMVNDFSDIVAVVQKKTDDDFTHCERKSVPFLLYRKYYQDLSI